MKHILKPKLFSLFEEGYSAAAFHKDLVAGIVVGILAVPMSIAFAIASGARPEQGLYTAIIAGFLAAFFSGSKVQITGPTGAFIVLVYETIDKYGYEGLVIATLIAGVILIALGLSRVGAAIKFIPYPLVIGFTSGIALLIFTTQVRDFTGIPLESIPNAFLEKWLLYFQSLPMINPMTIALSLASLFIVIYWPYVTKIPGALIAIIFSTVVAQYFQLNVETVGDRFGVISSSLPTFQLPQLSFEKIRELLSPGIAIALLAGIESLLSAVVADGMTGQRHRSDMELISQGIANIGSSLFAGLPATGAIARTAVNIKTGGETPVAGLIHAIVIAFVLLFLGKAVALVPLAALSAILMVVAYRMSEWHHFVHLFRSPPGDIAILLTTFFLTIFEDLVLAIEVGIILSALIFIYRMAEASHAKDIKAAMQEEGEESDFSHLPKLPSEIELYEIRGPLFFAAAEEFKETLIGIKSQPKVLILLFTHVLTIDASGMRALSDIIEEFQNYDTKVLISGANDTIRKALLKGGVFPHNHEDVIFPNFQKALEKANAFLDKSSS